MTARSPAGRSRPRRSSRHVEVDVLLDRTFAVLRVDDRVAAVAGEGLLDLVHLVVVYDSPLSCRPAQ